MTSTELIDALCGKINETAAAQLEQAANLGSVKSATADAGVKTRVSVSVSIERVNGKFEILADGGVTQTQTDKLDPIKDGFDPDQLTLPMKGKQ